MDNISTNLELLNNFKKEIFDLITVKNELMATFVKFNQKNDIQSLNFKLRSYSKWNQKLNQLINGLDLIKNNNGSNIDNLDNLDTYYLDLKDKKNIKKFKLTTGLEKKLIEFMETNKIEDIIDTKNIITELNNSKPANMETIDGSSNIMSSNVSNSSNSIQKIDTSKIEAIPKNMLNESRPKDKEGGMIYDLKLVTGIGNSNAKKFVEAGISLEGLIQDWTQFVQKDANNSILMLSKMGKPNRFSDTEWNHMDSHKKHKYLMDSLKGRLLQETKYLHKLNHHQLIGIKYFDDISKKIPREEIQIMEKILKTIVNRMSKEFIITICGSYRRGRSRSGDVDTLLTHPSIKTKDDLDTNGKEVLSKFVFILEQSGFLIDHLTDDSTTKYMGVCMCPKKGKIARRIDIRFVPYESYGAAILYFTGSKNFNTAMRSHALHKGYTLSEYGLFKLVNGKKGEQVSCPTEKDIFKILDYQYSEPVDRDI